MSRLPFVMAMLLTLCFGCSVEAFDFASCGPEHDPEGLYCGGPGIDADTAVALAVAAEVDRIGPTIAVAAASASERGINPAGLDIAWRIRLFDVEASVVLEVTVRADRGAGGSRIVGSAFGCESSNDLRPLRSDRAAAQAIDRLGERIESDGVLRLRANTQMIYRRTSECVGGAAEHFIAYDESVSSMGDDRWFVHFDSDGEAVRTCGPCAESAAAPTCTECR